MKTEDLFLNKLFTHINMINEGNMDKRMNDLYKKYKKRAKNDEKSLRNIIKKDFVNSKYGRTSNQEVDFMWGLMKKDFPS